METVNVGGLKQIQNKPMDNVDQLSEAARYQASALPEDHERAKEIYKSLLNDMSQPDEVHREVIKRYTLLLCPRKTRKYCNPFIELLRATIRSESAKDICSQIAQTQQQKIAHFQIAMDYKNASINKDKQGTDRHDKVVDRKEYLDIMYRFHLEIADAHGIVEATLEWAEYSCKRGDPWRAEWFADKTEKRATAQNDKDTLFKLALIYEDIALSYGKAAKRGPKIWGDGVDYPEDLIAYAAHCIEKAVYIRNNYW